MGKMLVFLLGLAVLLGVGYHYFEGEGRTLVMEQVKAQDKTPSMPKQRLDRVRQATQRIELQGQQNAERAAGGTGE